MHALFMQSRYEEGYLLFLQDINFNRFSDTVAKFVSVKSTPSKTSQPGKQPSHLIPHHTQTPKPSLSSPLQSPPIPLKNILSHISSQQSNIPPISLYIHKPKEPIPSPPQPNNLHPFNVRYPNLVFIVFIQPTTHNYKLE